MANKKFAKFKQTTIRFLISSTLNPNWLYLRYLAIFSRMGWVLFLTHVKVLKKPVSMQTWLSKRKLMQLIVTSSRCEGINHRSEIVLCVISIFLNARWATSGPWSEKSQKVLSRMPKWTTYLFIWKMILKKTSVLTGKSCLWGLVQNRSSGSFIKVKGSLKTSNPVKRWQIQGLHTSKLAVPYKSSLKLVC